MKKLAIILDSFCGRRKDQVEKNAGMFFVPLQIEIEQENFKMGMSKSVDQRVEKLLLKGVLSKTSMPNPGDILEVFKKVSKEYENTIYFPPSSAISGTAKMAMGLAQDFTNIKVIENHFVGEGFIKFGEYLIRMANEKNMSTKQIETIVSQHIRNGTSQAFVIPMSIDALVRSGRIGKIASNILGKMKAIPIISYEWDNKKLHSRGIKRSPKKAIEFAIAKIDEYIANRPNFKFLITTTPSPEMKAIVEEVFKNKNYNYSVEPCSPITISAVGEKAVSISAFKIL